MSSPPPSSPVVGQRTPPSLSPNGKKGSLLSRLRGKSSALLVPSSPVDVMYGELSKLPPVRQARLVAPADPWAIHPDAPARRIWEGIIMVAVVMVVVIVPFAASFRLRDDLDEIFYIMIVLDVLFWIDLVLNFFTGHWLIDDELVMHLRGIRQHYTRFPFGGFWLDIIGLLPLDYCALAYHDPFSHGWSTSDVVVAYRLLALIRLLRLPKLLRYSARAELHLNIPWIKMSLTKNVVGLVFFLHWLSCAYMLQAKLHNFSPTTWIALNSLQDASEFSQYSYAVVATMSLLTTNGFGVYLVGNPVLLSELLVMTVTMLLGAVAWAVTTSTLAVLILSLDPNGQSFVTRLEELNRYLRERQLPPKVRARVRDYFDRRYKNQVFDEDSILAELPISIRRDVGLCISESALESVPLFTNASRGFINAAVALLRHEWLIANEIVLLELEPPSHIYFIGSGTVVLLRDQHRVANCGPGSFFGEISMLWGVLQPVTAFTKTSSEFFTAPFAEFKAILEEYEDVHDSFKQVARRRIVDWVLTDCAAQIQELEAANSPPVRTPSGKGALDVMLPTPHLMGAESPGEAGDSKELEAEELH